MGRLASQFLSTVLLLVILATQAAAAVHRGQMAHPSQTIVICDGHGLTTLRLDANGAPIAPTDACVECEQLAAFVAPVWNSSAHSGQAVFHAFSDAQSDFLDGFSRSVRPPSRAPPSFV